MRRSILVENVKHVLQNSVKSLDLPNACMGFRMQGVAAAAHHERTNYDGETLRSCAVVTHDAVKMEDKYAEGGIVGVRELIDTGVQKVTAVNLLFFLYVST